MASMVPANTAMESRVGDADDGVAEASSEQKRTFLKTFTVVENSQVTVTVEPSARDKAGVAPAPPRTLPVVDAQLQKYAQKLRARLRDGAAARVRGNIKAPPVPQSVAALVTARRFAVRITPPRPQCPSPPAAPCSPPRSPGGSWRRR
jgi:hypothetical protein